MLKDFLSSLPKNLLRSFSGKNIFWHLLAIFLTAVIVLSGLDWRYFLSVRSELLNALFFPALVIGMFLPIFLPLGLIIRGKQKNKTSTRIYGWALLQAAALGWIVSSLYKAFTGREQPALQNIVPSINQSLHWNFGFWEHGIFWGWPSSHTTVAFAMVAAFLVMLNKKNSPGHWLAILYAFYIGVGISFSIHWLSEFVAGAIIGSVIGMTVGMYWKSKLA